MYFMPGLAAGPKIFENLTLDEEKYTFHYLKWIEPLSLEESIGNYAKRLSKEITAKDPVLIGVSFGGILVQELAKFVQPRKVIIVSSVKSHTEFPKRFKFASVTKIYKLFPTVVIENFEEYTRYFVGKPLQKKADLYKKYLSVRGKTYLKWSIYNVLKWEQKEPLENIVHIHGTKDTIFPIKSIKNSIEIEGGTHAIILTKAKKITQIINEVLSL